jgi:intracellular sulfur oxidation DsrE/DsrF family protein
MRMIQVMFTLVVVLAMAAAQSEQRPVIKEARGYWPLPKAAVQPDKTRDFKVIFDATRAGAKPEDLVPALEDAAQLLNQLGATELPAPQRRIAIIFHGPSVSGILDDASYKEKYGIANPNLKLIHALHEAGVELFVCGQFLHFRQIDPAQVVSDVQLATSGMIVLVTYQNRGYGLLQD